ncbi:MAG: hypothetical protein ACI9U2_002216 [Bradymonadia bacterium]|jgi:hypothetical protein
MYRVGLVAIAALGLSAFAGPCVFATASNTQRSAHAREGVHSDLMAALDDWCSAQDDQACVAWRAESNRSHALQSIDARGEVHHAQIALRETALRLHLEAQQTSAGWQIDAVRGARTVRCGTTAFETVRATVRSASAAWATRVDGCSPDALRPIEVERAALRPVLMHGEPSIALVTGPEVLALAWRDGAWQVR